MNEMQFFHFGLMPYPFIPPGSEIESTWVTLSNAHYDPKVGARLYQEYLSQAVLAEKLGYDGTCVNEHHQNAYGTMPDPNVMGSQIVARTSKIPVGIIGNALPLHDNPRAGRRGGRDARRAQRGPDHLRLRARDGHGVPLDAGEPGLLPRAVLGGPRPHPQGVDRRRARSPGRASTTTSRT